MGAQLYLASTSPRRRELLLAAGIPFALLQPGAEPDGSGAPAELAMLRARAKALGAPRPAAPGWILGVDTVVGLAEEEFGKPVDRDDAARMLHRLQGREHQVFTGHVLCQAHPEPGRDARVFAQLASSTVYCRLFSAAELSVYLDTGDWADKAGAYGIQSAARDLMQLRQGALDTVIGLHLAAVEALLEAAE